MTRQILFYISLLFLALAAWFLATDLFSDDASRLLGEVWFSNSPGTLQVTEAIISRYIDPCGLIGALDCSTFLWHPVIATLLLWPAGLFFLALCGVIFVISRLFSQGNSPRKKSTSSLKRAGR